MQRFLLFWSSFLKIQPVVKITEQITTEKLHRVQVESGVKKLEDVLQGGEAEKMLLQTEIKLSLTGKMLQWKPREPSVEESLADKWK